MRLIFYRYLKELIVRGYWPPGSAGDETTHTLDPSSILHEPVASLNNLLNHTARDDLFILCYVY